VQHEAEPLGRRQRLEHDEQREADGVGQDGVAFRVRVVGGQPDDRLRQPGTRQLLTTRLAPTQRVQGDAADDDGQPAAQVVGPAGVAAIEP
jgi:hypothetical protein